MRYAKPKRSQSCSTAGRVLICISALCLVSGHAFSVPEHDLSTEKVLYTVGTAHLDTQWRWTIQKTIDDYIKKTLDDNFSRFEQYPNYTFSFEGAFRYMLMKEYYPQRYQAMAGYISQGRWRVAGSTLENGDMNVVSPESLIRQALIGNNFFEDEFNKRSTDIFLPDCFGFSYTLPTWAAHCGINGFSSQKLSWGGAVSTPFDIGVWKGPDGSSIIAALNPGAYTSSITSDLSNDSGWLARINALGDTYGIYAGYKYFGTGDTGGAPSSGSCDWLEQSIAGTGPITVDSAASDQLFNDITPAQKAQLPVYDGELLMRIHGNGCYTSQAAMKRWNRQNELLADAAERAAVMADWLGAVPYPQKTLDDAWIRFLWHSFHDDLTGTSIPEAYRFSWNDEILSLNQFSTVLGSGAAGVCQALDTQTAGIPLVVYNPLGFARHDIVEATVLFDSDPPACVRVYDGTGEVPSQVLSRDSSSLKIAFAATVPSVGWKVFDVRPSEQPCTMLTGLTIAGNTLENEYYRVTVNSAGDIASIWDKQENREILAAPSRLELLSDYSPSWPAWEIRYEDVQQMPYAYVGGLARIKVLEQGPARVSLQVTRTHGFADVSTFVQTISLTSGPSGQRVTVRNAIDWRTTGTLLKASFPMTASNAQAAYDLGMGTIQRPNNRYNLYEVPAQQWADITNSDNAFGVSVLNDCRYGWDKPADNILRLTLLHTPSVNTAYTDQQTQDLGQHLLTYAIAPHEGDWVEGEIPQRAAALNQPLVAFQSDKHSGFLGQSYSFLQVDNPQVSVKAVKKAQRSDELIVRFQELYGTSAANIRVSIADGIQSAREVDGCERDLGPATVANGRLEFSMTKYQPKTFAVTLAPPSSALPAPDTAFVQLPYNMDAFSTDANRSDGDFTDGLTYPAELAPDTVDVANMPFRIGSRLDGRNNALYCSGQAVYLGTAGYQTLYVLAASRSPDTQGVFTIGAKATTLSIQDYHQHVVDWGRQDDVPYLKRDPVAWVGTHRHAPDRNQSYEFCYMFLYRLTIPSGATSLILPDNNDIVIFAMTLANNPAESVRPASQLYDQLPYLPQLAPKPDLRANLALNKPVEADGFIAGENPELAVDGSTVDNSKWCVNTGTGAAHWLVVDLQQWYDVDTFVVRHAGAGGEGTHWNTRDFAIQTSANGIDGWQDLVTVQGNTESVTRHVIDPVSARYLRLYITVPAQDTNSAVRIYEFEIYGPCDGYYIAGDVWGPEGTADCRIDMYDLQKVAEEWSLCNEPLDPDCSDYWLARFGGSEGVTVPSGDTAALPADTLVAYWRLSEGGGGVINDTAGANDAGTLAGSTAPAWAAGWFPQHQSANHSLYFGGSGYAVVEPVAGAGSPNLHDLQDAITISAWFKADDWNGNRRLLQKGESDRQYRLLAEWGNLVFDVYGVGRIQAALPSSGAWHHAAAVYDGTAMRLYIDGVRQAMAYAGGQINLTTDPLYLGTKTPQAPSGDYYKGYMDDIRIYAVGLTEEQVRTLAQQGQNVLPVILDINRQDDMLTSVMGSTYLEPAVYDVNGDALTYQWSETTGSADVTFTPDAFAPDPEVTFARAGDYTVQLAAGDASGQYTTQTLDFHISQMDCEAVKAMNFRFAGDVNRNCRVDMDDLLVLCSDWLNCVGPDCP